jgi:hypothetical protein
VLGISGNEMWRPINAAGADFWANLKPLPWCTELMTACTSIAPTTILTSPSKDPRAAAGKTAWLQRVFGSSFRDYLIGPAKAACAHRGAVLIDDSDEGCKAFEAAGGRAVVFPQPWNSGHAERRAWLEQLDGPPHPQGYHFEPRGTGPDGRLTTKVVIEQRPVAFVRAKLAAIEDDLRMGDQLPRIVANAVREYMRSPGLAVRPVRYPAVPEATRRKLAELRLATDPRPGHPHGWPGFESLLQSSRGATRPGPEPDGDTVKLQPIYKPLTWSSAEVEAAMARSPKFEIRKARETGGEALTFDPELALRRMHDGPTLREDIAAGLSIRVPAIGDAMATLPPGWTWSHCASKWHAYSDDGTVVSFTTGGEIQALDAGGQPICSGYVPAVISIVREVNETIDRLRAELDGEIERIDQAARLREARLASAVELAHKPGGDRIEFSFGGVLTYQPKTAAHIATDPEVNAWREAGEVGPVEFWDLASIPPGWVWEYADQAYQARSSTDVLVGYDADGMLVALDREGEPVLDGEVPAVIEAVRAANPHKLAQRCAAGCGALALADDPTCGGGGCIDDHRTEAERENPELDVLIDAAFESCPACGDLDKPVDGPCPACGSADGDA